MPIENNKLNVVAVGASAGGVEALTRFAASLEPEFPYAVLVVLHLPTRAPSVLASILDRSGPLPATEASEGAPLEPGTIQVAVPEQRVDRGPVPVLRSAPSPAPTGVPIILPPSGTLYNELDIRRPPQL